MSGTVAARLTKSCRALQPDHHCRRLAHPAFSTTHKSRVLGSSGASGRPDTLMLQAWAVLGEEESYHDMTRHLYRDRLLGLLEQHVWGVLGLWTHGCFAWVAGMGSDGVEGR